MEDATVSAIRTVGPVDPGIAEWNDRMYAAHPTPYGRGIAGFIEDARVGAVLRYARVRPADAVLEVGCEAGRLLARVPACRRIAGADISMRALTDAAELLSGRDAELYQLDAQRGLPFERGEFDVLICSEMIEHVERPADVIAHLHALATPGTRVVVSVPIEAPKMRIKRVLRRIGVLGLLFPGIEPEQSEWHVHAFSARMLRDVVGDRFEVVRATSVWLAHHVALLRAR